jgi:hypothetical protein
MYIIINNVFYLYLFYYTVPSRSLGTAFWCLWNGRICELVREELRAPGVRDDEKITTGVDNGV